MIKEMEQLVYQRVIGKGPTEELDWEIRSQYCDGR